MSILITGATGTIGASITQQLLQRGHTVQGLSRKRDGALPDGADLVVGDLTDPSSFERMFAGVQRLHLIGFTGEYFQPLPEPDKLVRAATDAGVQHVTLLVGPNTESVEEAVRAGAWGWTLLRPVEFMSNSLEWAESIRTKGVVEEDHADALSALVHEDDVAAVAAVVLSAEGAALQEHREREYTLTGPEVLTRTQKAAVISAAIDKPVRFVELPEAEAVSRWQDAGFGQEDIDFFLQMATNPPAIGRTVSPDVARVTGRSRTFSEWAQEHREAFL